jgi:hypothetical protein
MEELSNKEDKLLADVDAALDAAEEALTKAKDLILNVKKVDNDYKSELSDRLTFFVKFQTTVESRTGHTGRTGKKRKRAKVSAKV